LPNVHHPDVRLPLLVHRLVRPAVDDGARIRFPRGGGTTLNGLLESILVSLIVLALEALLRVFLRQVRPVPAAA
jgi:hypothetical protein